MLLAHLTILSIWVWLWLIFFGWGTLACQLGRCRRDDSTALVVTPWVGVGIVVGVLQLWHLAWPVDQVALAFISAVGLCSALWLGRRSLAAIPAIVRSNPRCFIGGVLLVAWLANRSLSTQDYIDHGMYYLNAIRWASDYAIVPGLTNLHARFGFNNSNFLLHAMWELGSWRGYTAHIFNGLFAALTVPIVVPGVRDIFVESGRARQLGWFTVGLGMIVALSSVDRRISSANPEFPAGLLATVAAWRLLAITLTPKESSTQLLRWNLLSIAVLATTAITFKTSVIFFVGLAGLALVLSVFRLQREQGPQPFWSTTKLVGFLAAWAFFIFTPWVVRGYILSGYPLFPATVGGAPVDWKYSPALAERLRDDIYAIARTYYKYRELGYQSDWEWVWPWIVHIILLRAPIEVALAAIVVVSSLIWIIWSRRYFKLDASQRHDSNFVAWLLAACYAGGLIAWFLTAPAARMATFAWWGLTGTLLGLASQTIPESVYQRHRNLIIASLAVLLLLPMMEQVALVEVQYRNNPALPEYGHHSYHYFPFVLRESSNAFPALPLGTIEERTNDLGLKVYVGVPDEDGWSTSVWDSPLPTARYFNEQLKLRDPDDMQRGFMMIAPQTGGLGPPRQP